MLPIYLTINAKRSSSDLDLYKNLYKSISLQVKELYNSFCTKIVGNGRSIPFWEDMWLGDVAFSTRFHKLFNIYMNQNITVADALRDGCQHMTFRRNFSPETFQLWEDLKVLYSAVVLGAQEDSSWWLLEKNGKFSVRSFYNVLITKQIAFPFKYFWSLKIPLKIKVSCG